jgi:hypothetical protein
MDVNIVISKNFVDLLQYSASISVIFSVVCV